MLASALSAVVLSVAVPAPVPVVTGPLPGKPVAVAAKGFPIVAGSVREVGATGSGAERVPLYVARGRHGELCVGTSGMFRCLGRYDGEPAYAFTVFGGHGRQTEWGAVVGFVEPGTRVTLELQQFGQFPLPTKKVVGFPLRVFLSRVYHGNGGLPDMLRVFDLHGNLLSEPSDLGFLFSPCANTPTCPASWHVGGDVATLSAGPHELNDLLALDARAKAIALNDPLVRRLLAGRRYSVAAPGEWTRQQGGLIGAFLTIHLTPHGSFTEDWPFESCSPNAAYSASVVHLHVTNVSELEVWVDTRSGHVVGVDPTSNGLDDAAPQIDQATARVVVKPHPAGGPDKGTCETHD